MARSVDGPVHQPAIAFSQVSLSLGDTTIYDSLSFEVGAGEFVCLLGPSGCGKSSTLRLIGDLLPYQGGTVSVEGMAPKEAWERLAYVFQTPRLLPWKNALDNAAFGLEMRYPETGLETRRRRAIDELTRLGLGGDAYKMPSMLSGGERQRVAIARALALDPHIILMDEPFSALDMQTRTLMQDELLQLWSANAGSVVFVTHDLEEAIALADRVFVLTARPATLKKVYEIDLPRPRVTSEGL